MLEELHHKQLSIDRAKRLSNVGERIFAIAFLNSFEGIPLFHESVVMEGFIYHEGEHLCAHTKPDFMCCPPGGSPLFFEVTMGYIGKRKQKQRKVAEAAGYGDQYIRIHRSEVQQLGSMVTHLQKVEKSRHSVENTRRIKDELSALLLCILSPKFAPFFSQIAFAAANVH